jgi:cytochrome c-type biogenesis protein
MTGVFIAAFAAGLVATVNPCGFAMLPAYLGYLLGEHRIGGGGRVIQVGGVVSLGFVSVFVVAGAVITAGIRAVIGFIPWLAAVIGAGLVVIGLGQLFGHRWLPSLPGPSRAHKQRSLHGMFAFGASYAVASLSCTLPIFLSLIAGTVAGSSLAGGIATFVAYGAGMASAVFAITVAIAVGKDRLISRIRRPLARRLNLISGWVLVAAGGFIVWYWATVLGSGAAALGASGFVRWVDGATSAVAQFVAGRPLTAAAALVGIAVIGLALLSRRGASVNTDP